VGGNRVVAKALAFLLFALLAQAGHGWSAAAQGRFLGEFELIGILNPSEGREKRLKYNFGFVDPDGVAWEARAGLKTDGASIPEWALPIIGGRYSSEYIKAAVLHDHYCDRRVRTWEDTHRMFYHALRAQGVPELKALTMYYAVYNYGPKWQVVRTGERCELSKGCIRGTGPGVAESAIRFRAARFDAAGDLTARLARLEQDIAEGRLPATMAGLEALSKREQPGDPYFNEPSLLDRTGTGTAVQ
jgi:Protein of unknown function (DUF1353)